MARAPAVGRPLSPDPDGGRRASVAGRGGAPGAHPHMADQRPAAGGGGRRSCVRRAGDRGPRGVAGHAVSDPAPRGDSRGPADLRPLKVEMGYLDWAEGSALLEVGKTRVLASASFEPKVPRFLQGSGSGWVTAEYAMLPRATAIRTPREVQAGRPSGRTQEIQRLVGRSLRSVTALERMGETTIWIDCDVLQADGGTRTASITAGYLALAQAVRNLAV